MCKARSNLARQLLTSLMKFWSLSGFISVLLTNVTSTRLISQMTFTDKFVGEIVGREATQVARSRGDFGLQLGRGARAQRKRAQASAHQRALRLITPSGRCAAHPAVSGTRLHCTPTVPSLALGVSTPWLSRHLSQA